MIPCPSTGAHLYQNVVFFFVVERWGIRKTKRFLLEQIEDKPWEVGKLSRARGGNYYILFLNPSKKMDGHQLITSAIDTMHRLQRSSAETFSKVDAPKPRPVVASFLINPIESPQYAFRMNIVLPHWALPTYARIYGPRQVSDASLARAMSDKMTVMRVRGHEIPVKWFMPTDLKVKIPAETTVDSENIPLHVLGGNIHETAGLAALLAENKDWRFARNIYITIPGRLKTRWKKAFGRILTEIDALATNGKNVHVIEIKSIGPRTIPRWDEIVVYKAQALMPGIKYIGQTLGPMRTRIFPHFVAVSNSEHVATELANRALITLKPHETFRKLMVHAVWPSDTTLLKRSFKEPWW